MPALREARTTVRDSTPARDRSTDVGQLLGFILLAARWLVAGIFLRSGLAKTTGLAAFRSAVANYRLLPPAVVTVVAMTLPFAEILAAVLLAVGVLTVVVAAGLAFLLVAFALAIGINLARGRVFDCGCAGSAAAPRLIGWRHVMADLVLAAMAAAIAVAPPAAAQLWRGPAGVARLATPGGGAFPVLLAACLGLVMTSLLRRTADVRDLAIRTSRRLDAAPGSLNSRRH
jgi:uncharacterized membrane protein YphA (DoxX/SURF4 family)